jgi:hypothetical protein
MLLVPWSVWVCWHVGERCKNVNGVRGVVVLVGLLAVVVVVMRFLLR